MAAKPTPTDLIPNTANQSGLIRNITEAMRSLAYNTTSDPTVNSDIDAGYQVNSIWINTSDGGIFVCTDNSAGAAVWTELADAASVPTPAFENQLLHVREEQTSGTNGGTFTAGAWQTRTLNTTKTNEITSATLSSNQVSLPAGTYYLEGSAPALFVGDHKAKIRNVTDSSDTIIGTSEFTQNAGAINQTRSIVNGKFTIAGTKSFELQHRCIATKATNGFGEPTSVSVVEVYSEIKIWKVG